MEPSGIDSAKWEMGWKKDSFNLNFFYLKRPVKDSLGNNIGLISFEFDAKEKASGIPKYLIFGLSLDAVNNSFIKQFDIDSINSNRIRDSLLKKRVGTGIVLPYNRFYVIANDSIRMQMKITEFFMGYSSSKYRGFRMLGVGALKDGTKISIITGDVFFDKILKQSSFMLKTKKRVELQTRMN